MIRGIKMRMNHICLITVLLPFFTASSSAAELDAVVENCSGCHGDDGVSQWSDMPTIAGIPEFVHADSLYFFRDNERPCSESGYKQGDTSRPATTMCDVVSDMSDDTIDEVAAYYAVLPFVAAQQDFDAGLAAAGKAVHDAKCAMCHSDGGANPDDEASILAGQWMGYLKNTFAEYAAGDRGQPKQMQKMLDELSNADVTALLHYYASQQ